MTTQINDMPLGLSKNVSQVRKQRGLPTHPAHSTTTSLRTTCRPLCMHPLMH